MKEWVAWVDKFFDVDDAGVYLREIPNDDPVEDMPSRTISAKKTPPNPPKPNKCTQCADFTERGSTEYTIRKTPPNPPKPNKCTECTDFTER